MSRFESEWNASSSLSIGKLLKPKRMDVSPLAKSSCAVVEEQNCESISSSSIIDNDRCLQSESEEQKDTSTDKEETKQAKVFSRNKAPFIEVKDFTAMTKGIQK
jgi:hypothetical protein